MRYFIYTLLLLLCGCSYTFPCDTYNMGNKLTIKVCSQKSVQKQFEWYMNNGYTNYTNKPGQVVGFYVRSVNTIYTIKDFDVLLHELYHFSGNLKEPYWEEAL